MIATLTADCTLAQKAAILRFVEGYGLRVHVGEAGSTTVVSVIGDYEPGMAESIGALVGVASVSTEAPLYPFVAREARNSPTTVRVGDVVVGGPEIVVIAGPCSVESEDQIDRIANGVAEERGGHASRRRLQAEDLAHTASRGWVRKASSFWRRPARRPGSEWSPSVWLLKTCRS